MKLNDLIKKASSGYPDNWIWNEYWDNAIEQVVCGHGDTFAHFIAIKLKNTFDAGASDDKQLVTAIRVMERMKRNLAGVIAALEKV